MADHIPFLYSKRDCDILKKYYGDSEAVRVSLESIESISIENIRTKLPNNVRFWIDPAIDAYHQIHSTTWPIDISTESPATSRQWPIDNDGKKEDAWKIKLWGRVKRLFGEFAGYEVLTHRKYWVKRYEERIKGFVVQVMDRCLGYSPTWITVPQLPIVNDGSRNQINKMLAEGARDWKMAAKFSGKLILPLVFTNQRQLNSKPVRDKKLESAIDCYELSAADGLWIVESTLSDQNRNEHFGQRYAKLIEFHTMVNTRFPTGTIKIAGPYWGANMVLWARGLCDYPGISLGAGYTYYISCGEPRPGNVRLAIPPLRRWAVAQGLRGWLRNCVKRLDSRDPSSREFDYLITNFDVLKDRDIAANQIAEFYKKWFDKIGAIPAAGRALALYQDLSAAFVLGRQLPCLPQSALPYSPSTILEAGKVAEQLMLKCL